MKTTVLVYTALLATFAQAEPLTHVDDIIKRGPRAGEMRSITNTTAFPTEASVLQREAVIALRMEGQKTDVAVELVSLRHQVIDKRGPFTRYEFQIRAKSGLGFVWSCWTPDFLQPHRFQVLTTESGQSYACYIREGVHLFRLSESRPSDAMRRAFWEDPEAEFKHPDALPLLGTKQVGEALGRVNTLYLNAVTLYADVVSLSDREGELRVTVRGKEPQPQATFALRHGQWELVSTTGK